jgi:hypothetical protein
MNMKRLGTFVICLVLILAVATCAVEKKEKDRKPTPAAKTVKPQDSASVKRVTPAANSRKATTKDGKTGVAEKKYDDFVDNNHNGIDDRKENLVTKEEKK